MSNKSIQDTAAEIGEELLREANAGGEVAVRPARVGEIGSIRIEAPEEPEVAVPGLVRGYAWLDEDRWEQRPNEIFFLPNGVTTTIPHGSAIRVFEKMGDKGQSLWHKIDCPLGAEMTGPLLWGWGTPTPQDVLIGAFTDSRSEDTAVKVGVYIGMSVVTAVAVMSYVALDVASSPDLALPFFLYAITSIPFGAAMGGFLSGLMLTPFVRKRALRQPWSKIKVPENSLKITLQPKDKERFGLAKAAKTEAISAPAMPTPQITDPTILQEISQYREECDRLIAADDNLDRRSKAVIEHGRGLIDILVERIARRPEILERRGDLGTELVALLRRARQDVQRAQDRIALEESNSIQSGIRALQAQLDHHGTPQQDAAA